jgi:6-phospho-3-hexuloisomerase
VSKIASAVSRVGYVNKIKDNIFSVRKKELLPLYQDLRSADCVVCGGSGRSLFSLNAAMSQIAISQIGWRNKVVLTPDDPGFPGRNMYDAASELQRRYKKTLLLINSGSGSSEDPLTMAEDLARFVTERQRARAKFSLGAITSDVKSPIAQIVREHGHIVKLKGRGRSKSSSEYGDTGIMGDVFELGSLLLLCMMVEAVFRNLPVGGVFELCEEEFAKLGEIIDSNVESDTYTRLVDILEKRTNVFLGGKGTANEIVKMAAVRLFHIKSFLGDNVHIARGVNTPHPRPGDLEILVSFSGETRPVIVWCDALKRLKGFVLAITGADGSTLSRKSDFQITLNEKTKLGQPRRFYMRAAYVLSPLPVKLAERLGERGLELPEPIIKWYHSVIE